MFNRQTLLILIAALAAGLGLYFGQRAFPTAAPSAAPAAALPTMQTVRLFPHARAIAPFALQQSDGTALEPADLQGHWSLVFLGFTHCPDVCPTTLGQLAQAQKTWESIPAAKRPRVVFVSVDPERDSPAKTGEYAAYFHTDTLSATADLPTLETFVADLAMVFAKVPLESGDYTIDHSATLSVHDPSGAQVGIISPPLDPAKIAADLRALTESRP